MSNPIGKGNKNRCVETTKEENKMPTIFFYGPKMEKEKKKELIKSFTETASRLTGVDTSAFVVYLQESNPENVGVGSGTGKFFALEHQNLPIGR